MPHTLLLWLLFFGVFIIPLDQAMSETDTASVSAGQGTMLLNQAGAIAITIKNPDIRTEVLYRVANNYLNNNHLDAAVSVMGRMQDDSLKASC